MSTIYPYSFSCFPLDVNLTHLSRFWKRAGYIPLYLRQTQSELTGEHTCVMVRGLNSSSEDELQWLGEFAKGKLASFHPLLIHLSIPIFHVFHIPSPSPSFHHMLSFDLAVIP